jgi:hypothetical protein
VPRWWLGLVLGGMLTVLAGCGSRTPAPQVVRPAAPGGFQTIRYSEAGFTMARPRNWTTVSSRPPLVALITSGPAVISLWRYPAAHPEPRTSTQLHQAALRLIATARARSRSLRVLSSATTFVNGYPAVELETNQVIGGAMRRVQSTHLYGRGGEVVLEEYAPLSLFGSLERSVFSVVRRSLSALGR